MSNPAEFFPRAFQTLREVFEKVKKKLKIKIDILGMDVCLMSMVEVCYELNGLVEYLVSSESYQPSRRLALRTNPREDDAELQKNKEASTEELAKMIVE